MEAGARTDTPRPATVSTRMRSCRRSAVAAMKSLACANRRSFRECRANTVRRTCAPAGEAAVTTPALSGLRVVELTSSIPGEFCGRLLADAGAEVVKLEGPQGSALRRWSASGGPVDPADDGVLFQYLGSSKRSVLIDPRSTNGRSAVLNIIGDADAVIWSPDWELADEDGFGAESLSRAAPGVVLTAITPFGLTG